MKNIGIYIHIPFCKSKCYYCDFNSYSNLGALEETYIDCLLREIEMQSSLLSSYKVSSIFIGGGTPTYLHLESIEKLLKSLNRYTGESVEFSCEANPGTLTYEKLCMLKLYGVNRLSIGLQSWDDNILKRIGRIHSVDDFLGNFYLARSIGFNNINVDIMFSIPGQTFSIFEATLKNVINLGVEHISCYSLIIEEGTVFGKEYENGNLKEADEELDRKMYHYAVESMAEHGYLQYEISNFSKQGYQCKHNKTYWKCDEYLGFGAGAHSYIGSKRFSNTSFPKAYIENIKDGRLPIADETILTKEDMIQEFMFMGLRMNEGVSTLKFRERFGSDMMNIYRVHIDECIKYGLLKIESGSLKLTERGIDLSNQVFVKFI